MSSEQKDLDEFFMAIAALTRTFSPDPKTKVGAVIVGENNQILGTGYNSSPNNCENIMPWHTDDKQYWVVHAEANAILNKTSFSLKNSKLYCTLMPCSECAKLIIQSGITKVTFLSDFKSKKPKYVMAKKLLEAAGVVLVQYKYTTSKIIVDFEGIQNNECPD